MIDAMVGLNSIDWDFADSPSNGGIHSIHPYPAKFIPQIPSKLIELFHPQDSSLVLDPFCGCGTALVESMKCGIDSVGVDLNPLACFISKVKTTMLPDGLRQAGKHAIERAVREYESNSIAVPDIPRLGHWFKTDVQKALAVLVAEINKETIFREALRVALSSIIVRVSNQESDTRYAAIDKNIAHTDVFRLFERSVIGLDGTLSSSRSDLFRVPGRATILNSDTLKLNVEDIPANIGLVITSPPYPNAYEYWLYHKYRMYWLGMDPIKVRKSEIGARPNYFKVNSENEFDFERQMEETFALLAKVLCYKRKACFVVGRSIIHGRVIDNTAILARAGTSKGFVLEGIIKRRILASRKTFNPKNSRINEEHILVFSKT